MIYGLKLKLTMLSANKCKLMPGINCPEKLQDGLIPPLFRRRIFVII